MSIIKMTGSRRGMVHREPAPGQPIFPVEEERWTCIAHEHDGVTDESQIGRRTITRTARFAFKADALVWLQQQAKEGFTWETDRHGEPRLSNVATNYSGPTDAPGNCWGITVTKDAP